MKKALVLLGCCCLCAMAAASEKKSAVTPPGFRQSFAKQVVVRASAPVITATGTAPGQAGYAHYFLTTAPGGEEEIQVGIELPDRRIAWAFPEQGVVVTPFIAAGPYRANGKIYEVRHLYGIRPFPDDESMLALQKDLLFRVIPWVEDETPYCFLRPLDSEFCMNCLGFVMRVLFPGPSPSFPAVPRDFKRMGHDAFYTSDDLLLYLAGLHGFANEAERLQRLGKLALPDSMREELARLVALMESDDAPTSVAATNATPPRSVVGKIHPRVPAYTRTRQAAPRSSKDL